MTQYQTRIGLKTHPENRLQVFGASLTHITDMLFSIRAHRVHEFMVDQNLFLLRFDWNHQHPCLRISRYLFLENNLSVEIVEDRLLLRFVLRYYMFFDYRTLDILLFAECRSILLFEFLFDFIGNLFDFRLFPWNRCKHINEFINASWIFWNRWTLRVRDSELINSFCFLFQPLFIRFQELIESRELIYLLGNFFTRQGLHIFLRRDWE